MRFQTEVWERYADSQNRAKRALRKATAKGTDMQLPVLNDILDRNKLAYTVELGIVEIPVKAGDVLKLEAKFHALGKK